MGLSTNEVNSILGAFKVSGSTVDHCDFYACIEGIAEARTKIFLSAIAGVVNEDQWEEVLRIIDKVETLIL